MNEKKNKRHTLIIVIMLVAIVLITVGGTYAFFITQAGRNEEQKLTVKTGSLALTFEDNDEGLTASLSLGQTVSKEFKIRNTGTESVTTTLLWSGLTNTYLEESLQYRLQYKTNENGEWQDVDTAHSTIPHSETTKDFNLSKDITIPSGLTYYYKLDITFLNLESINQENDKTAKLITKFNLGKKITESRNVMMARGEINEDSYVPEKLWIHGFDITSIVFQNTINPKSNAEYTYDMSDYNSEGITAYIVPNDDDNTKYTAYIQADGQIILNKDSSNLFRVFTSLQNIIGIEYLDTSKVTDMYGMFWGCSSLTSIDVSNFDTSKVTNMGSIFCNCSSLTNLDVRNFDTSNVIYMWSMFEGCNNLTSLDVRNFDTSKVTSMSYMFHSCSSLTSLDVSKFDTSNVTNMMFMFYKCSSLTNIDVSKFDTSNVTDMQSMFGECTSLTNLNLDNFDTSKTTVMFQMFKNCNKLTSLNLGSMNTDKVTSKEYMFLNIPSTIKITVGSTTLRDWVIEASDNPKLTSSNFIVG